MDHQLELAYLGIEVPDPSILSTFLGDVIGLVAGEPDGDGVTTWRNDDRSPRVIVRPGPANDAELQGVPK